MINGSGSTSMSTSNWIRAFNYTTSDGDGFGNKTTGLMANSGNAFGMAVFQDTAVTVSSVPVDVIFIATGGSLYTAGPPEKGYLIANTDFYDIVNPITAVLTGFRETLLQPLAPEIFNPDLKGQPLVHIYTPVWAYATAMLLTFLILWSGYAFFNSRKWQFVERY